MVLVAYGISSRISKEAVNMARAEGFKLGLIRPITLWPYPVKAFETCKNAKAFMTVEINILGQMVDDVKLAVENKYPVGFYGTFFGLPEPEEIVAQAKADGYVTTLFGRRRGLPELKSSNFNPVSYTHLPLPTIA